MAQTKKSKQLFNLAYGLGASIVIIGALFKINHYEFGLLTGSLLLAIGLGVEALIFAISAFEPVEGDLDWTLVYPELGDANSKKSRSSKEEKEAEVLLSKKLDEMLQEARIDSDLMNSLGDSIRSFEGAAKSISPTTDAMESTKRYSEEVSLAAAHMESLNSLYKVQLENANRQAMINEEVVQNADKLKEQMENMAAQLASLNGIYGGMLTAMNKG